MFKFGTVGAAGVGVQLFSLQLLLWTIGGHYLIATGLAVEASVLFNFVWHRRWTWADRPRGHSGAVLLRFNVTNGAVSLLMNIFLMYFFVGQLGLRPVLANVASIAICSIVNFTLADRLVFV